MRATLEVQFSSTGEVEIIRVINTPTGPHAHIFVQSTVRAVQRCAPYENAPAGEVTVNFARPVRD